MSEQYQALYRKYRPQTFEDVRGREAIVRTLKNQINKQRIGHSYLFCGTRGTGKTTIAKIFAKAVNCEDPQDGSPCGKCPTCLAIEQNANLNVVEMDAASNNGVDDIRNIIDEVSYSPTQGRYRVYIIDEVHMLSTAAFNALLKTLEEPPSYVIFILATTEPNRLPLTILSRCQRYDFGRLSSAVIEGRLKEVCGTENISAEPRALAYIAAAADGSMRDGLSLLDQCAAFNIGEEILTYDRTLEILGAVDTEVFHSLFRRIHEGDAAEAIRILKEILEQGKELTQFTTDFTWYLRNVMLLKASEAIGPSLDVSEESLARMTEDARLSEMSEIMRDIRVLSALTEQIRYAANRRILAEMAMLRLCTAAMDDGADNAQRDAEVSAQEHMAERIRQLEEKLLEDEQKLAKAMTGAVAVSAATGPLAGEPSGAAAAGESAPKTGKPAPTLPAAVPDDVKKIVASWSRILAGLESGYLKATLQKANLSLGEDGQLLIVFDNPIFAASFTDNEDNRKELEGYLAANAGKTVAVEYRYLDNGGEFKENYVDLQDVIKMDIGTEDF